MSIRHLTYSMDEAGLGGALTIKTVASRRWNAPELQTLPVVPHRVTSNWLRDLRRSDGQPGPAYRPPMARSFPSAHSACKS